MVSPEILIEAKNISRKYLLDKTEIRALDNLSCTVYKKDFLVIAGPSGSGKTTLLNMLGCIDKPSGGKIIFEGADITNLSLERLSHLRLHHIGFIFQSFNLVPVLTAFENIELPLLFKGTDKETIKDLAQKFLQRVGIADKINQKPGSLSGGQRQRLAIARALAGHPSLIVADEPTASLDRKNAESIIELLRELNEELNVSVVIASHDPMVKGHAKKTLFIRDGRAVEE
ncbi:MAG TPA: ABC transporter ATP-binding protein [Chitinophagaceae bacterium]|nr:ABC transporter ATP-binding protein [Chitinophagaceae bacterium]